MARVLDLADRVQRRVPVLGVPIAVVYKFYDDRGNFLAATMTYYAFVAIFPLLMLGTSILGFVLQGNPDLQQRLLDSALSQFPIVGTQLGLPEGVTGSTTSVVVGALTALYGALGLGQAVQYVLNVAWSVPRNSQPNPILLRIKSLVLLLTAGVAVLGVSALSILGSSTEVFAGGLDTTVRWAIVVATVLVNWLVLTLLFRLGSARNHRVRSAAPGAFVVAILWQVLQFAGTLYVTEVLTQTSAMNQTFGLVLGLIGIIYIASVMGVIGIEVNVVLTRRLWPRALLTPFTDAVELTEADRRAYAGYARAQRHKGFEKVEVTFDNEPTVPIPLQHPDPVEQPDTPSPRGPQAS